ncbi:hypothetical protein [Streptomyces sp. NPDC050546]|uniref:hypothetical protein n=1 Tax=Streptomyces sp. NPDC050546 TaxID=3365628 RepID=UPI0037A91823
MAATGASASSASSGPSAGERVAAPPDAQARWWRSGFYEIERRCDEDRKAKVHKGVPTDPTRGCYRNTNGYYFSWYGSFWD